MKILVDIEERRSSVPACLRGLGIDVESAVLPHGDYLVDGRIAVERKTVADLHRSIVSGRLWAQLPGLAGLDRSYLVVEGENLDAGHLSREGVRGAILRVLDSGVAVIRSESSSETALWLRLLALRGGHGRPLGRRGRRRRATTPVGVLTAVPGVSPLIAERLLSCFGSVASIAQARPAELQQVEGVGPVRSRALRRALAGPPL